MAPPILFMYRNTLGALLTVSEGDYMVTSQPAGSPLAVRAQDERQALRWLARRFWAAGRLAASKDDGRRGDTLRAARYVTSWTPVRLGVVDATGVPTPARGASVSPSPAVRRPGPLLQDLRAADAARGRFCCPSCGADKPQRLVAPPVGFWPGDEVAECWDCGHTYATRTNRDGVVAP